MEYAWRHVETSRCPAGGGRPHRGRGRHFAADRHVSRAPRAGSPPRGRRRSSPKGPGLRRGRRAAGAGPPRARRALIIPDAEPDRNKTPTSIDAVRAHNRQAAEVVRAAAIRRAQAERVAGQNGAPVLGPRPHGHRLCEDRAHTLSCWGARCPPAYTTCTPPRLGCRPLRAAPAVHHDTTRPIPATGRGTPGAGHTQEREPRVKAGVRRA